MRTLSARARARAHGAQARHGGERSERAWVRGVASAAARVRDRRATRAQARARDTAAAGGEAMATLAAAAAQRRAAPARRVVCRCRVRRRAARGCGSSGDTGAQVGGNSAESVAALAGRGAAAAALAISFALGPVAPADAVVRRSVRGGGTISSASGATDTELYSTRTSSGPSMEDKRKDVPQSLGADDGAKPFRIERPVSPAAENCTRKCVATCTRGTQSSFNVRKGPADIVFQEGFRPREYCLSECSQVCNILSEKGKLR